MSMKIGIGVLLGILALALLGVFKPRRGAARLRNAQGVGPSHVPGVPRGEEQVLRNGAKPVTTVAGRIAGSVDPD
jgi:hypothetical protein